MDQLDLEQDFQSCVIPIDLCRRKVSETYMHHHTMTTKKQRKRHYASRSILGMVVTVLVVLLLVGLVLVACFVGWIMPAQVLVLMLITTN